MLQVLFWSTSIHVSFLYFILTSTDFYFKYGDSPKSCKIIFFYFQNQFKKWAFLVTPSIFCAYAAIMKRCRENMTGLACYPYGPRIQCACDSVGRTLHCLPVMRWYWSWYCVKIALIEIPICSCSQFGEEGRVRGRGVEQRFVGKTPWTSAAQTTSREMMVMMVMKKIDHEHHLEETSETSNF